MEKATLIAAEKAADFEFHKMEELGATLEDCVNAGAEAYEAVAGVPLENPFEFFGFDEDENETIEDTLVEIC